MYCIKTQTFIIAKKLAMISSLFDVLQQSIEGIIMQSHYYAANFYNNNNNNRATA
jgi:hypothetical protein